ncbi:hypothetical protein FJY93_01930 [Candidatus Kaiserbacteria bacterium]|nr:hypothetical protein [Candidatus Kaiserbacteria bacterium]
MRKDKEEAEKLRREGASYNEIYRKLKIPRATLSDWFSQVDWSQAVKERLSKEVFDASAVRIQELNKIRGARLERVYDEARNEARHEFEALKYNPLFIAGIMLYWGEGDKRNRCHVRLINTDPDMVKLFVFFLKNTCLIPEARIKAAVTIYPDLDPTTCVAYWSKHSEIKREKFTKPIVIQGRHKTNRLSYGMCTVVITSTYFKVKMLEWIKLLPKQLMEREYYVNITNAAGLV